MTFDALIFDIDGTLWDSCEAVRHSWQLSLRRRYGCFGSPDLGQVRSIMGLGPDEIAQRLFSRFGARAREVFDALSEDECAYLAAHGAELYPGVAELLPALAADRRLFIVSNCQRGYAEAFLGSCGFVGLFTAHATAGCTGLDKRGNLEKLLREHSLEHAVFIGDTVSDEQAARETGCIFIHAAYGFGRAERPDAVLRSFAELPEVLETLEKEG
jgi:phosphoglycolate phosphatase